MADAKGGADLPGVARKHLFSAKRSRYVGVARKKDLGLVKIGAHFPGVAK